MMGIDLQPYTLVKPKEPGDEHFLRPFTIVDSTAAVWNVATNRNWLVAVRGKGNYPRWSGDAESFNMMLSLIQAEPIEPYEVEADKLSAWLKDREELGRVLDVVISLSKLRSILNVGVAEKMLLWNVTKVAQNQPCIALAEDRVRLILMGHDEPKIEKGTTITLVDPELLTPVTIEPSGERAAFDLAMALGDDG